jgi:hypothetical protein
VILQEVLIVIVSVFLFALITMNPFLIYASTVPLPATTVEGEPRPGTIMIVTFVNGTTKAIKTDSTNIQAVDGGYFITDASVKASQPLEPKTVSETVVQQLVSVLVDVRIDDPVPLPPPTSSEGCGEGFGYHVDDPSPICEPLDKIGKGPPPDMAFCAALGCPYNPPAETELPAADNGDKNNFATTPVTPTEEPAVGAQPEPQPEPDPGDGNNNQDGGEEENQNGNSDGGDGDGSTDEEESGE